jgi:hypothetical protein|tara:strand:- start:152 stop:334 length:183 start_codon:yes stop_codon:yes gene_type:complete
MSREFVDAVIAGNNIGAEEVFASVVGTKVGDALEIKRKDLANTFVKTMSVETEGNDDSEV